MRVDVDVLGGDAVRAEGRVSGGGGFVRTAGDAKLGRLLGGRLDLGLVKEGLKLAPQEELEEDAVQFDGDARHGYRPIPFSDARICAPIRIKLARDSSERKKRETRRRFTWKGKREEKEEKYINII